MWCRVYWYTNTCKNARIARRKCGGALSRMEHNLQVHVLKQICNDFSWEIVVNSPSQKWWQNVGSRKSVSCNDWLEIPSRTLEHYFNGQGAPARRPRYRRPMFICYFVLHCCDDSSLEGLAVNISFMYIYIYIYIYIINDTNVHLIGDFRQETEFLCHNNWFVNCSINFQ